MLFYFRTAWNRDDYSLPGEDVPSDHGLIEARREDVPELLSRRWKALGYDSDGGFLPAIVYPVLAPAHGVMEFGAPEEVSVEVIESFPDEEETVSE